MAETELVCAVDLEDRVVGAVPRAALADPGVNFRVVHVLARDRRGDILLQRPARSLGKSFAYGSSVAGHVRPGESYLDAARREYREELGVPPPALTFLGKTWLDEGGRRKFVGVFLATEGRPLSPDPREVDAVEAFPVSAVRAMVREEGVLSATFRRVLCLAEDSGALGDP